MKIDKIRAALAVQVTEVVRRKVELLLFPMWISDDSGVGLMGITTLKKTRQILYLYMVWKRVYIREYKKIYKILYKSCEPKNLQK